MPDEQKPVITLREVTPDNFDQVIGLRVREEQKHYVASNTYSLAEAYAHRNHVPLVIYGDETPVGFLMYTYWEQREQHWIFRLMIAADHQGRGYGRKAMHLLIDRMRQIPGCKQIYISYEPNNNAARVLYASLGFWITGEIVEEEEAACLDLA